MSPSRSILGFIGWLIVSFTAAAIGAVASINAAEFYQTLTLPTWAPPAWLFGPVWALLYLLMAVAAWIIWRARGFGPALALFLIQLAANALWSWLFFAWKLGAASFVEILILWLLIIATIVAFYRVRPRAAALLIPYLLWVTFAAALNFTTWQMNPHLLR
jgi:translocator protein